MTRSADLLPQRTIGIKPNPYAGRNSGNGKTRAGSPAASGGRIKRINITRKSPTKK